MGFSSEIFLTKNNLTKEEWQNFINIISNYIGLFNHWTLTIKIEQNKIRYFINTKNKLPSTINNLDSFILSECPPLTKFTYYLSLPMYFNIGSSLLDVYNYCEIKNIGLIKEVKISFCKIGTDKILSKTHLYIQTNDIVFKTKMLLSIPANLLSINFATNKRFTYKSVPKYLDINKVLHLLNSEKTNSVLKVDTFPYLEGDFYLPQNNYSFAKHSLILGSSGSGKSKFIASFIANLNKPSFKDNYKVVLIDPHASLENDIGGLGKVIDFKTYSDSINLFASSSNDIISTTENLLDLFKSLIADQYNSKLERVLRHAIYLLISTKEFNFNTLRQVILDVEYRHNLLKQVESILPSSVIDFFLTDFNDLRTKSYSEAISPIIAFIDEMEMIPVFNETNIKNNLKETINDNFLTIFSLDRTKIGDKVTKTISGLIMEQLLTLVEAHSFNKHIIFIIDEVAVIENPILSRFLSESRKYNLSLILASQYFNQISQSLKDSIFANVINYYLFRVSKLDATLLVDNLNIKIPLEDTKETKIKLLSELNNRECLIRIDENGLLLPVFKARTLDFTSIPRIKSHIPENQNINQEIKPSPKFNFNINNVDLNNILKTNSSSRIEVK